jgi:hypothetical protein
MEWRAAMQASDRCRDRHPGCGRAIAIAAVAFSLLALPAAHADDSDAKAILNSMTDYLAGQKTISATYDSSVEVVTTDLQKIAFTSSGSMLLERPNKVKVTRTGGFTDTEMTFDGKSILLLGKRSKIYLSADATGTVAELVAQLRNKYGLDDMAGADLFGANAYETLMTGVYDAKHIGHGVIDGVECEHLAFRAADDDWQIWIESGVRPIPRQFIITSKSVTGAPQYALRIKQLGVNAAVAADAFSFNVPPDARKVSVSDVSLLDEIPRGAVFAGVHQ